MDNKVGVGVGGLILVAITIIVGVIMLQASAQQIGEVTNTVSLANQSMGTLTNGTALYVTNCRALSDVAVFNATGDVEVDSANYTVTNNVIDPTTGGLAVSIEPAADSPEYSGNTWYMNATAQPVTYIADSGARGIAAIIVVFFALAIAVVALWPALREMSAFS